MFAKLLSLSVLLAGAVESLDPYQLYAEGSCSRVSAQPARNLNRAALEDLRYITGGSRYHLLREASPHPRYSTLRDDEFYYGSCLERNTTTLRQNTVGSVRGFGRTLASFDIVPPRNEQSGLYLDAIPRDSFPSWDTLRQTVSLTDNRNYAVVVNCWVGSDQVGWDVISRNRNLDQGTRRIVEEHVRGLGFNPENFVTLRHESCQGERSQGQGQDRRDQGQGQGQRQGQNLRDQNDNQRNLGNRQNQGGRQDNQGGQRQQNLNQQRQSGPQGPRQGQGQDNSRVRLVPQSEELGRRRNLVRPDIVGGVLGGGAGSSGAGARGPQGLTLRNLNLGDNVEDRLRANDYRGPGGRRGVGSGSSESDEDIRQGRLGGSRRDQGGASLDSSEERRSQGRQRGDGRLGLASSEERRARGGGRQGVLGRLVDSSDGRQGSRLGDSLDIGRGAGRLGGADGQRGDRDRGNRGSLSSEELRGGRNRGLDGRDSSEERGARGDARRQGQGNVGRGDERRGVDGQRNQGGAQRNQDGQRGGQRNIDGQRGVQGQNQGGQRNLDGQRGGQGQGGQRNIDGQRGVQGQNQGNQRGGQGQGGQRNIGGQGGGQGLGQARRGPDGASQGQASSAGHGWSKP